MALPLQLVEVMVLWPQLGWEALPVAVQRYAPLEVSKGAEEKAWACPFTVTISESMVSRARFVVTPLET